MAGREGSVLADLLSETTGKSDETLPHTAEGQILLVQSIDQVKKKKKKITDVASWSQAFASYVATLAAAEATTKEELAGLMAHQHVIIQLQKDLGGLRWLLYDQ